MAVLGRNDGWIGYGAPGVAGEGDREGVTAAGRDPLHVVDVLSPGCEHGDPASPWFHRTVQPVPVHEDEPAALELVPVIAQVEERSEVERLVGLLVHVRVPVLVVDRFGRLVRHLREEGRRREMDAAGLQLEMVHNSRFHLILGFPVG